MRETRLSGSEGGGTETNRSSLPLSLDEEWPARLGRERAKTREILRSVRILVNRTGSPFDIDLSGGAV